MYQAPGAKSKNDETAWIYREEEAASQLAYDKRLPRFRFCLFRLIAIRIAVELTKPKKPGTTPILKK